MIINDYDAESTQMFVRAIMSQQYDGEFEVIVVRESEKGETLDALKPIMAQHKNLSTTYIPDRPQYISDSDVAIMLGTKAAHYDNIIIVHTSTEITNDQWLTTIGDNLNEFVTIGTPHYPRNFSFIKRLGHRKLYRKDMKKWCEERGLKSSRLRAPKTVNKTFAIHYKRTDYLADNLLRIFVSTFIKH